MSGRFFRVLKVVTAVHVGILLVLILISVAHRLFRKKPPVLMPIEFVVEVPRIPSPEPDSIPDSTPKSKPKTKPKTKPKPKSKPKSKPVQTQSRPKSKSTLTKEEIKKLLEQGAKPSDHTSIPDQDSIHFELVRRALYNSWSQPSKAEAGDSAVEVTIRLQENGSVIDARISRKSGNSLMDASVLQAVNSVRRIDGLKSSFIKRYPTITIAFKVQ